MSEHGFEVREVPYEPPDADGERLQESVVGDVAASVSALAGTGAFGYAAAAGPSVLQLVLAAPGINLRPLARSLIACRAPFGAALRNPLLQSRKISPFRRRSSRIYAW